MTVATVAASTVLVPNASVMPRMMPYTSPTSTARPNSPLPRRACESDRSAGSEAEDVCPCDVGASCRFATQSSAPDASGMSTAHAWTAAGGRGVTMPKNRAVKNANADMSNSTRRHEACEMQAPAQERQRAAHADAECAGRCERERVACRRAEGQQQRSTRHAERGRSHSTGSVQCAARLAEQDNEEHEDRREKGGGPDLVLRSERRRKQVGRRQGG